MFCNLSRSHLRRRQSKLKQPDVPPPPPALLQELYRALYTYCTILPICRIRQNESKHRTSFPLLLYCCGLCEPLSAKLEKKLFSSNLWHYWECAQACPCAAFVFFTFAHYLVIWFPSAPSLEQQNRGLRMSINWALFPPCLHLIE